MPFASKAQMRWAHTPSGMKALGGAAKVAEWDSATRGKKLPKKVRQGRNAIAQTMMQR